MTDLVVRAALNSLALLGFRADKYFSEHPQLKCGSMDATTFDKGNEKALLLCLHFLLANLYPEFEKLVAPIWPYYEVKAKNEFKVIVQMHLDEVANSRLIPSDCCKASIISTAKGYTVWKLLWKLSNVLFRKISATRWGVQEVTSDDVETLTALLEAEHENLVLANNTTIMRQREQFAYSEELGSRFKAARRNIDKLKREIQALEAGEDTGGMLDEGASIERTEMMMRIQASCSLLKQLSESSGIRSIKEDMSASISPFENKTGLASFFTGQFLKQFTDSILSDPKDRRFYIVADENDLNELLDVLIDKLRNSANVKALARSKVFREGTIADSRCLPDGHKNFSTNSDRELTDELIKIESSMEMIRNGVEKLSSKLSALK